MDFMATEYVLSRKLGFDLTGSNLLFVDGFQYFRTVDHGWFSEALTFP